MADQTNGFQTIDDLELSGKRVLVRVDFNVPLTPDGRIANDRRMRATLPTIRHLLKVGARIILISHLGRPGGEPRAELSLRPVAEHLETLLEDTPVRFIEDWQQWASDAAPDSGVALLENLRFHPEEKGGDEAFAKRLAALADAYVNDAFATCHRKHASLYATALQFPESERAIGRLVYRELDALKQVLDHPKSPLTAVLGGAKVADKLGAVEALLRLADNVLVGGALAYTFLEAAGGHVGASPVEHDQLDWARKLLDEYSDALVLPADHVIADVASADAPIDDRQIEMADGGMPPDWAGMDIGPKTIGTFTDLIYNAETIFWNGPLGKFEDEPFRHGTESIARAIAASEATSIIGGGETGQAVDEFDLHDHMDHVSTGGGAFLTFLEDRMLPALTAIPQGSPTP